MNLKTKYGMTLEDLIGKLDANNWECELCNKKIKLQGTGENVQANTAVVDHCHQTGKVRGILCHTCNQGLGKLGDTPESILKAYDYLSKER